MVSTRHLNLTTVGGLVVAGCGSDCTFKVVGLVRDSGTSKANQPVTPAVLAVLDTDPVEILLRNQVAVGLLPTLGLKPRDREKVGKRGRPYSDGRTAFGVGAAGRHTDTVSATSQPIGLPIEVASVDPEPQRTLTLSPTEVAGPVMLLPE